MKTNGLTALLLCLSAAAAAPALAGPAAVSAPSKSPFKKTVVMEQPLPPEPEPYWSISAGAIYRGFGDVDFHTGSRSAAYALPRLARSGGHYGGGAGIYDNGYVLPDGQTPFNGRTGYWGYENESQVQDEFLIYNGRSGSGSFSQSRSFDSDNGWSDDDNGGWGPIIETSYLFPINDNLRIGPQASFMWTSFDASETTTDFRARQVGRATSSAFRDAYDVANVLPLPDAPYAGGPSGGGRFSIPAFADGRQVLSSSSSRDVVDFFNRIDEALDVDVYTLSFGAVIDFDSDRFFANLGGGLAINFVDWEATHRERLYANANGNTREIKEWREETSDTDVLYGGYVQGVVGVKISGPWYLGALGRYDWNEELNGEVGPSSFSADLNAWTAGVVIGGRF